MPSAEIEKHWSIPPAPKGFIGRPPSRLHGFITFAASSLSPFSDAILKQHQSICGQCSPQAPPFAGSASQIGGT